MMILVSNEVKKGLAFCPMPFINFSDSVFLAALQQLISMVFGGQKRRRRRTGVKKMAYLK